MAETDPSKLDKVDQEIRINELKEEARELTGGQMTSFEAEDAPPEVIEAFWRNVVEIEKAGWTTPREELAKDGVALPPPEELDDGQVTEKLWELIKRLAARQTFIDNTNHLSDRELYERLWRDSLNESCPAMTMDAAEVTGYFMIDLVGSGSEEHMALYMKYYANEESRRRWLEEWPDFPMPPRETPPYDRDRLLPKPPEFR